MTRARTRAGKSKRGKPRAKRPSKANMTHALPVRPRRRKRPPPVTHEVLGLRCHVKEVLLLDQSLVLMDDVDGRQFALPLSVLVGRDALANIEKGQAVWLSVRVHGRTPRG